jgi:hypothetical protein
MASQRFSFPLKPALFLFAVMMIENIVLAKEANKQSTDRVASMNKSLKKQRSILGASQEGWLLAGTNAGPMPTSRTRGGGHGRPNLELLARKNKQPISLCEDSSSSSEDDNEKEEEEVVEVEELLDVLEEPPPVEGPAAATKTKPANSRVILEVNSVEQAFGKFG